MKDLMGLYQHILDNIFSMVDTEKEEDRGFLICTTTKDGEQIDIHYYMDDTLDIRVGVTQEGERVFSQWLNATGDDAQKELLNKIIGLLSALSMVIFKNRGTDTTIAQEAQKSIYKCCT